MKTEKFIRTVDLGNDHSLQRNPATDIWELHLHGVKRSVLNEFQARMVDGAISAAFDYRARGGK